MNESESHKPKLLRIPRHKYVSEALLLKLKEYFNNLGIQNTDEAEVSFDITSLSSEELLDLALDLKFFLDNPHIPLENLCSRLNNYYPQHETQEDLINSARHIVNLNEPYTAAGLFMYGNPGVGKTHIAVAVSKEFMRRGLKPVYIRVGDDRMSDINHALEIVGPDQVWIIDDLNWAEGDGLAIFKRIVMNAHDHGGRVFVTSNMPYEELVEKAFSEEVADNKRYRDRIEKIFKVVRVDGESYRGKRKWF